MTSRRSARTACIAVATSLLGIFAAPHVVSAASVTITVTDSGGTAIPRAFVAVVNSDGDATDSAVTGTDGTASVDDTGGAGLVVTAPGFQTKTSSSVAAQTVALTATTKTKLSFSNAFGGQIRTLAGDGESGVFYATSDAQPSVWRTSDYAGSWSPVPTSADTDSGGMPQESAGDIFTSGVKGEVAVQSGNNMYFSRNYGNTWTSVSTYSSVNGVNKKHYWIHGGAANEYSYIFVRTDNSLWAAVMPDSNSDGAPTFTNVTSTIGRYSAGDRVAFARGSGGEMFMAAINGTAVQVSQLSGVTSAASIAASAVSFTSGPTMTLATGGNGLIMMSTLGTATPQVIVTHLVNGSTKSIEVSKNNSGTWANNSALKKAGNNDSNFSSVSDISGICGQNNDTPLVGSIAPAAPSSGVLNGFEAVGTIGQCMWAYNSTGASVTVGSSHASGTLILAEMNGANNNTGFVWDSAYDFSTNMVAISGDGQFGLRKSALLDATTQYRPSFGSAGGTGGTSYINSQAAAGTATTSGGIAVNGLSAPNVTDMTYSPNSTDGSYVVTSMTETGGSRTLLSTDGGKTYSTICAGGSRAVDWWNGASGLQHIVGAFSNNPSEWLHVKSFNATSGSAALQMGDELAATAAVRDAKTGGSPFVFPSTLSGSVTLAKFANAEAGKSLLTKAIKGVPGYNKMLVAVNRCSDNIGPTGCSTSGGSVGMVTFTVDGTSGAQAVTETRYFGADVATAGITADATSSFGVSKNSTYSGGINGLAVCPTGSVSRVADSAFIAVNGLGIYKISGLSGSTQAHSGPLVSGTFNDLKVDCDTGLMVAAGSDGPYFSLNGSTFTKINTSAAPAGGGGGGPSNAPTAVAVQADATSGEVVIGVASGNGDIKAVETNLTALGTTGAAMTATGAGPTTPTAAVSPATDAINEVNSSSTGRNTGAVKDLEVPKSATDKVTAAGVRVMSVRAMATSLSLAAGTGGGAFTARVNSGGSSTSSGGSTTATTAPTTATTVTPVVVKTPTVVRGKTLTVVSALTTAGTTVVKGSKTSVVVATASKKICSATSTTIKGLLAGTCSLTVTVTPAKVTKSTNTTVTKGQSLTIASIASTNKLPSTSNATVAVTVSAGSKRICTVSANKTVKAIGSGKCTLTISVTGKKFTKKLLVKVS
ncbi:MAG: beta strand repeat-containing protein [Actinomycetota bacterium]